MTFSMVVFATPTPTKSTEPTGGVHKPTHKFKTITIPNWMGSIFNFVIIGRKMGVKIKTAGVISIKIPTNNKSKFMIKSITIGLSLKDNNKLLISWGMFS